MNDKVFEKKSISLDEFKELYEIHTADLKDAIRKRDEQTIKKCVDGLSSWLLEMLNKVNVIETETTFLLQAPKTQTGAEPISIKMDNSQTLPEKYIQVGFYAGDFNAPELYRALGHLKPETVIKVTIPKEGIT